MNLRALLPVALVLLTAGSAAAQLVAPSTPAAAQQPPPIQQVPKPNPGTFQAAIPHGELSAQPLSLSFQDAIERGLQYNLGLLLSSKVTDQARAAKLAQLSQLMPQVSASARETRQATSLRAFGIDIPGIPSTIGVANTDFRASVSAPLVDLHARSSVRASAESVTAAELNDRDARETVVLAVASAYLQTISAESAFTSAQADLESAQESYRAANARVQAGTSPELDGLRAQVEMQTLQQAVTQARNVLDKQRLALLRIVGLPLRQEIVVSSQLPYKPLPDLGLDEAVRRALEGRADYKAAQAEIRAAQLALKSAQQQKLPTLSVSGDYGALGTTPANVVPTWSATALVRASVFDGGRIKSDVQKATAAVEQRQAELEDLRISVEQQIATALLDVRAAAQQVELAVSTVDFAKQALMHAQERFEAGFASNIEVVQAQEALATANTQYINALYAHNIAKLTIARAMGSAESDLKNILSIEAPAAPAR